MGERARREPRVRYVLPDNDDLVNSRQQNAERKLALCKRASLRLVVMIAGQLGDAPTLGAGIIFGRAWDKLFAITANHVIRRGSVLARDLEAKLKDYPDVSLRATASPHFDAELDIAVIEIELAKAPQIDPCGLLMFPLSNERELKRGSAVVSVGNPQSIGWGMSVTPEAVASVSTDEIAFQSTFLSPGHSGGALLDSSGFMVGMIQRDQPPYGIAKRLSVILAKVRTWGYVVELYQPRRLTRADAGRPGGADGYESFSLLEEAVATDNVPLIRSLLNACPDVNIIDWHGQTPLHLAARNGQLEMMKELIQRGADINARRVTYPRVDLLGGDDFFARGSDGFTVLETAIDAGKAEAIRVLLEAGADAKRYNGFISPIHFAAEKGNVEIIRLLGTNATLLDSVSGSKGSTPLHVAVGSRQLGVAKALIDMKASVNSRDGSGQTPLHDAVVNCSHEMVKLLLDAGADANAVADVDPFEKSGRTPLAMARRRGDRDDRCKEVQALLKARGAK